MMEYCRDYSVRVQLPLISGKMDCSVWAIPLRRIQSDSTLNPVDPAINVNHPFNETNFANVTTLGQTGPPNDPTRFTTYLITVNIQLVQHSDSSGARVRIQDSNR